MLQEGSEILEARYKVCKKLGSGAFGEIYKVEKKKTGEFFAAKVEKATKYSKHVMLFWESKLIHKLRGKTCVPGLYYVGTDSSNEKQQYHIMVMDMLGPSLEDVFQACKRQFDLKTVLMIAIQMLKRIEKVHDERIIHRDIKPDNFLIGGNESTKDSVFIIDFGLAKCYKNSDGQHIPYRDGKNLTGTARYASINTHKGIEQSRRDDLETIGHVLLYFLRGSLPWQGLPGRSKNEKYNNIKKKKMETTLEELCKGHPPEFKEFMDYCRALKFEEDPDYKYIIGLFEKCMQKNNFDMKIMDYTWKQNRLSKDKEALKNSVLNVIKKKQKDAKMDGEDEEKSPVAGQMDIVKQTNSNLRKEEQAQGYGATMKKEEMKTMALAGSGIMNSNQAAGQKPYAGGGYDTKGNQGMGNNAGGLGNHIAHKQGNDQYGSQNKRGSEFKKSAQHILGGRQ